MNTIIVRIAASAAGLLAALYVQFALAQTFPSNPVRIIVPWAAGGMVDTLARTVGPAVSESIAQPVIVENRPGGNSINGMLACKNAAPDGYTLCLTSSDSLSYNPHVYKNLPYDSHNDFVPVINLLWNTNSGTLMASAKAPFNSIKELIAFAKAKPGVVNWATWGAASQPDVFLQWLKHKAGVNITAVPYKGAGSTLPALLAGEVDITFLSIGLGLPHIKAGKLKLIAVIGNRRSPLFPDVPTLAEQGVDPGMRNYMGLFAPHGTPKPIVDRLNVEFANALQTPQLQKFLQKFFLDEGGGSAAEFAAFLETYRAHAGKLFEAIGIRPSDAPL